MYQHMPVKIRHQEHRPLAIGQFNPNAACCMVFSTTTANPPLHDRPGRHGIPQRVFAKTAKVPNGSSANAPVQQTPIAPHAPMVMPIFAPLDCNAYPFRR
jgi:hypothetical protein